MGQKIGLEQIGIGEWNGRDHDLQVIADFTGYKPLSSGIFSCDV